MKEGEFKSQAPRIFAENPLIDTLFVDPLTSPSDLLHLCPVLPGIRMIIFSGNNRVGELCGASSDMLTLFPNLSQINLISSPPISIGDHSLQQLRDSFPNVEIIIPGSVERPWIYGGNGT